MNNTVRSFLIATSIMASTPAAAVVVTSLPGGTELPIPPLNQFTAGPVNFGPGVTYSSSNSRSVFGWQSDYGFISNGFWSGQSMIGLNSPGGTFVLDFAAPISGFLGELNWTVGQGGNASIQIFNSANVLLEELILENGANVVAPGFYGFSRESADIASVRFNNEFIGVRNISVLSTGAVPEPSTWALMLLGFFGLGAAMRRQQRQNVAVSYA